MVVPVVAVHCRAEAILSPSCGPLVARQTAPKWEKKCVVVQWSVCVFFGHRKKVNGAPEEEKQNGPAPVEFVYLPVFPLVTATIISTS